MVEGALTSREHQRGNGTLPATKPKKVAESREKPKCRRPMVTIFGGIANMNPMSALPQKRTLLRVIGMSALCLKTT